jgi:hypothetical protein|tara:strand:- start:76 stop:486 length:411 start_codon:yes stop_codon:yes gene_type:complete
MAKLGRYSADRKKIESVTASKTVEVHDCGTVFLAVGDAAVTLTLPEIDNAGEGWWCKVIKTGAASGGQDITISAAAADGSSPMMGVESSATPAVMNGDDIVIADAANKGTQIEILCDGTNWQVLGHAALAAGITIS